MDENTGRDLYSDSGRASEFEPDTASAEIMQGEAPAADEPETAAQTEQTINEPAEQPAFQPDIVPEAAQQNSGDVRHYSTARQPEANAAYSQQSIFSAAPQPVQIRQPQGPVMQQQAPSVQPQGPAFQQAPLSQPQGPVFQQQPPQSAGFGYAQPQFAQPPVYPYAPQYAQQPYSGQPYSPVNPAAEPYAAQPQLQPVYAPQSRAFAPVAAQPAQPQYVYPQQPAASSANDKKLSGGKIALIIFGVLVELALLFFAIYGVIALASNNIKPSDPVPENRGQIVAPDIPDDSDGSVPDLRDLFPDIQSPDGESQIPQQIPNIGGITSPRSNPTDIRLGIVVTEVTDAQVAQYKVPKGLVILQISDDSSLKDTKAQPGDIITQFDGQTVETTDQLHEYFNEYKAGDIVKLTLTHVNEDGSLSTFEEDVELLKNDQQAQQQSSAPKIDNEISRPSV